MIPYPEIHPTFIYIGSAGKESVHLLYDKRCDDIRSFVETDGIEHPKAVFIEGLVLLPQGGTDAE